MDNWLRLHYDIIFETTYNYIKIIKTFISKVLCTIIYIVFRP